MDLKKFLPGQDKERYEYYWALVIEPGWIQAGIWRIVEKSAQVVSLSPTTAWETDEELVSASDAALSAAIQDFPEEDIEPTKTVFGVTSSWVKEGQIAPEYLEKIKKVCTELSLTPVGFVVMAEAISHLYKAEEGAPLNAVILGIYKDSIELSFFKLGNLIGATNIARSVSIVDDVAEGLARFAEEVVPSRFILYNGKEGELEEVRQALLKVSWEDYQNLKFIHTPKIEIVEPAKKVHAACLAGASEIAEAVSLEVIKGEGEKMEEVEEKVKEEEEKPVQETEELQKPEDVGFVVEKDIATLEPLERVQENIERQDFKTPQDQELDNLAPPEEKKRFTFGSGIKIADTFRRIRLKLAGLLYPIFSKIKFVSVGKRAFISGAVFLTLLFVGGFAYWWFYPKAVVVIYVSPKKLDEKVNLSVDTNTQNPNISERILPGEIKKTKVSGEKTKSTTGTKTIGEKAKGEVNIYRVGSEITLPSGTIVIGPENLKFSLNEQVHLASGSASSPGNTKAAVTAEDIGAQYNLAAGASFRVSNYSVSDMEAKNETSFSGGSSRDINAVSEDDQQALQSELSDELEGKAVDELKGNLSEQEVLIEESISSSNADAKFSNKVGDEAATLKLDLSLDIVAVLVNRQNLAELAASILNDKVPQGFVLRAEQVEAKFDFKDEEDGVYNFDALFDANLLPEINPKDVSDKLVGRYPKLAEDYLTKEIPGFVRAEIKINPSLPGRLGTLPKVAKNIEVEISAEK